MTGQTRDLVHDGRASLEVRRFAKGTRVLAKASGVPGWYVVRTCRCHFNELITVPFDSRARAERALTVLDDDARRYAA
jgi:hypothetical protein